MVQPGDVRRPAAGIINTPRVFLGLFLVGLGLLLTASQLGYPPLQGRHWWPLLIIALGVFRLAGAAGDNRGTTWEAGLAWRRAREEASRRRRGAVWLIVVGTWLGVSEWTWLGYHRSWPLLVVAGGAMMAWDAATAWRAGDDDRGEQR